MGAEGYILAALFGVLVGATEIVARYRDQPLRALWSVGGVCYVLLNAGAAALALTLIDAFGWTFGIDEPDTTGEAGKSAKLFWTQILVAGTSAVALFRSSLFSVRIGDTDMPIGPRWFVDIALGATDRAVDRARAKPRAEEVARIMSAVSYAKAREALPTYCFALMQNVASEEQENLAKALNQLDDSDLADDVKKLVLGLLLMNLVGASVLGAAVDSLSEQITGPVDAQADDAPVNGGESARP